MVADLAEAEREALINAAVWYAKYHEGMIASLADDRSARAVAARERHQDLYDALAKLGVRLHRPAGIRPAAEVVDSPPPCTRNSSAATRT